MILYELIQTAQMLDFNLCFTNSDHGFYFPAPKLAHCIISRKLCDTEVSIFTMDNEHKMIYARLKGESK